MGCGICERVCPEGIEMKDGLAKIKDGNANCLKDAVKACPVECIILEDNKPEKADTC